MRTTQLFWRGLSDEGREHGWIRAIALLTARLAGVVRDSFPDRRRMRYGDVQFDVDHRVNTTWANVPFSTRLREALINAEYQTTDPVIFAEAMEEVASRTDLAQFTFVDIGSGKGRVLLMAAEYPFRRIVGVELLPELHKIAGENLRRSSPTLTRQNRASEDGAPGIELVLGDAREFEFPDEPVLVFLFNPFPVWVLRVVIDNLQSSLRAVSRPAIVVLHNPVYEAELSKVNSVLRRVMGNEQFVIYGK